jgi:hypothetical protein
VVRYLALVPALVFAVLAVIHVYWAFGPRGVTFAAIPTRPDGTATMNPGVLASLVVAGLLATAAFLVGESGGWWEPLLPRTVRVIGTAGVAAVMALRGIGDFNYVGLFKRQRDSAFARNDTRYFTPLVLLLAALTASVVILGN